jgi:hypothetical protein
MKSVAVVGSSGGGAAGESMEVGLLETIRSHLAMIQGSEKVILRAIVFITSKSGLDFSSIDSACSLYTLNANNAIECIAKGTLRSVNAVAKLEDDKLAELIIRGHVDAVISMSSDPDVVNAKSLSSAIKMGVPIVGTGGKSMSIIASQGGLIIGCSGGSVASTQLSRAICFSAALARHWGYRYNISIFKRPFMDSLYSILGAALPMVLTSSLMNTCLDIILKCFTYASITNDNFFVCWLVLLKERVSTTFVNVVVGMIASSEVSKLNELSFMAGGGAAALTIDSLVFSILAGAFSGLLLPHFLVTCAYFSLLPTATTIIGVGGSSVCGGLLSFCLHRSFRFIFHFLIENILVYDFLGSLSTMVRTILGGILGVLVSWGSENGYYHKVMLPMLILEMEGGQFGMVGCFDAMCLCAPCAGVCAAVYTCYAFLNIDSPSPLTTTTNTPPSELKDLQRQRQGHIRLGTRGFLSNICMGDFVEACYPYSLQHDYILLAVRIACFICGGLIFNYELTSSAYLPMALSVALPMVSKDMSLRLFIVSLGIYLIGFVVPFLTTICVLIGRQIKRRISQ